MKKKLITTLVALGALIPLGPVAADIDLNVSLTIGKQVEAVPVESSARNGPPPWAPAHGRRAQAVYYYYPAHQVYRNASDGTWIYYDGGNWSVGVNLPSRIQIGGSSSFVALDMDFQFQWRWEKSAPGSRKEGKKGRKEVVVVDCLVFVDCFPFSM